MHEYVCKKSQLSCTNYVCKKSQLSCMNYACRKCQMSCGYQVAKIQPYNPPIITHEISNFILYDMCMRDDYHAHISHLSGIMKHHFFPSVRVGGEGGRSTGDTRARGRGTGHTRATGRGAGARGRDAGMGGHDAGVRGQR